MRFARFATVGFLTLASGFAAGCGGTVDHQAGGTTTGAGSGGTATTSTSTTTAPVDAGPDVDDGTPSTTYPAPFPAPPQVVDAQGPVLASPRFVPVFFSNDDPTYVGPLTDFDQKIGASAYWAAAAGDYGVGAGMATAVVALTEAAPATIDDTAIQTWLAGKLDGDDPSFPANDANTVYVLHYPAGTNVTNQGTSSCQDFGGYHSNITLDAAHGSADAAYAVIPRCTNFPPLMGLDSVTGSESHELVEAATDPYPMTNPAYVNVDTTHLYWARVLGGGEVGDMCAQFNGVWNKYPDLPYTVQSIWSNASARAGHDPCQPSASKVYFNAAPVMLDTFTIMTAGQSATVKGVKIPVGGTATVDVDLFSDGPIGPWTVAAKDAASVFQGGTPYLGLALDRTTGVNGEKLHLTITVMKAGRHNTETFYLTSKLNGQEAIWVGIVGN
jgi:hypothetical protein